MNVWIQQQLGCIISVNDHHRINGFERGRTSCFEPFYSWVSALAVSVWPTFVRVYKLVQVQPTWSLYASPNFLSSPPIRILSPHEAREWCQWRFLPTLSFLSGPWYSPQYISFTVRQHRYQALKAGDFSLIEHCTKKCNLCSQRSLCYDLAWTWHSLDRKHLTLSCTWHLQCQQKGLVYTRLPHPSMSCLARFRKSLSKSWHAETLHGSKTYNLQYLHSLLSSWM